MSPGATDEPELPRRPANAGPRGPSAPRSVFTPAERWVAEHQVKVLCMVVAAASPLLSLWMLERGTANLREGVWAYSVDGAGTIHFGPAKPADGQSALFREILLQAAQACFTRNPSGLSYPEVARRIFVADSWRALDADVRDQLPERKRRNLYDHPEVEGIDVLDEGARARYRVRGFIVRAGAVDGTCTAQRGGEHHLAFHAVSRRRDIHRLGPLDRFGGMADGRLAVTGGHRQLRGDPSTAHREPVGNQRGHQYRVGSRQQRRGGGEAADAQRVGRQSDQASARASASAPATASARPSQPRASACQPS